MRGLPYLGLFGEQKCLFQLCLIRHMLKSILLIEINHTRHLKHLEMLSGPHFANSLNFGGLTFGSKIKSMESSGNRKFTHNID